MVRSTDWRHTGSPICVRPSRQYYVGNTKQREKIYPADQRIHAIKQPQPMRGRRAAHGGAKDVAEEVGRGRYVERAGLDA